MIKKYANALQWIGLGILLAAGIIVLVTLMGSLFGKLAGTITFVCMGYVALNLASSLYKNRGYP